VIGHGIPTPEERERDALVPARQGKLAGTIVLGAGVLAGVAAVWMLRKLSALDFAERTMAFALPAALALLSAFFCRAGWRLFFKRRDADGSVVGARGWYALSVAFALFGTLLVFGLGLDEIPADWLAFAVPIASCFLLSYWCFHLGRNARAGSPDPSP
jgi:TRAP-type C4-dicarboxylate transport system permease small subunit